MYIYIYRERERFPLPFICASVVASSAEVIRAASGSQVSARTPKQLQHILSHCAVMKSISARIGAAHDALLVIKQRYDSKDPQVVAIRDDAFGVLEAHGLVTPVRKPIDRCGFHPRNRGRRGLTPSEVPKKMHSFETSGFSANILKPITVQRAPGKVGDDYENENIKLCNTTSSEGMLAPVVEGLLDSYTLTCNHSWQALKLAKIVGNAEQNKNNNIASVIEYGLNVLELPYQLESDHSWLIDLIIDADNVPQGIVVHDGTIDLCFKIRNLASELTLPDGSPDWAAVDLRARRTEVKRPDDIPHLVQFVRSSCMGSASNLLASIDIYAKSMKVVQEVQAQVLGKFESVYLGPSGCPLWREAVWKAIMRAPSKYIVNNVNTYVNQTDITNMGKQPQLKFVTSAEGVLEQARTIASDASVDKDKARNLFDVLGVRLVAHNAKRPLIGEFKSMLAIAGDFYHQMTKLTPTLHHLTTELPTGWVLPQQTITIVEKAKACLGDISAMTGSASTEQIVAHMKLHGVEEGCIVIEKSSKAKYHVAMITASEIKLTNDKNDQVERASTSMFLSLYDRCKQGAKQEARVFLTCIYIYINI